MKIIEASASRLYKHLSDSDNKCAIISAYRSERSLAQNKDLFKQLKSEVREMGYGYIEFISRWVEDGEAFDEESILIPDIEYNQALTLGAAYDQASIIYKDGEGCREICTNDFESYTPGDIVRVYNNIGPNMLNLNQARDIFAKKLGGPASKLKKGDKAFNLQVIEKLEARPSVFAGPEYYIVLED